jgi:hypothetical protein
LGLEATVYPMLNSYNFFGAQLNTETLLQFVGSINKLMDELIASSLCILVDTYGTILMVRKIKGGATIQDVDLQQPLLNPLRAVFDGYRNLKASKKDRLLKNICFSGIILVTAVCTWLLPLAINTLLIPKLIYHPHLTSDGWSSTQKSKDEGHLITPRVIIDSVYWEESLSSSATLPNFTSTGASNAQLASQVFISFQELSSSYQPGVKGWYSAIRRPDFVTAIDSANATAATARAVDIQRLWNISATYGPSFAKHSIGYWGNYNVTVPSVSVTCTSEYNSTAEADQGGIFLAQTGSYTTIRLWEVGSVNITSSVCKVHVQHSLFAVNSWTLGNNYDQQAQVWAPAALLIDSDRVDTQLTPIPHWTENLILRNLTLAMQESQLMLTTLASATMGDCNSNASSCQDAWSRFLIATARSLSHANMTENEALAQVLALWAQHSLSLAQWTISLSPNETTLSGPLWYHIYASGPRLAWEQTIVLVPIWLLFVLLVGIGFLFWFQEFPLECLTTGGMLIASCRVAQESGRHVVGKIYRPTTEERKLRFVVSNDDRE